MPESLSSSSLRYTVGPVKDVTKKKPCLQGTFWTIKATTQLQSHLNEAFIFLTELSNGS